ncbi:MAG: cupin domain-containing protein [Acidobacteriota bacterium]
MAFTRLPFPELDWVEGEATALERKKTREGTPATLLEFAAGFADPTWCVRGHVGLVLAGAVTFELEGSTVVIGEGEGFLIDPGTRHRARNDGKEPVRLFIVSPAFPGNGAEGGSRIVAAGGRQ